MKMMTIQPNGAKTEWILETDKISFEDDFSTLRFLIEADGHGSVNILEFVRVQENGVEKTLIVDEDGISHGREVNPEASKLYGGPADSIYGTAILVDGKKLEILD